MIEDVEKKKARLKKLMETKPTLADAAFILGLNRHSIETWIKKNYDGITYTEFRDIHMAETRRKLVKVALEQAMSGENNTMLIFCLKNLCGWADKQEVSGPGGTEIKLKYSVDNL